MLLWNVMESEFIILQSYFSSTINCPILDICRWLTSVNVFTEPCLTASLCPGECWGASQLVAAMRQPQTEFQAHPGLPTQCQWTVHTRPGPSSSPPSPLASRSARSQEVQLGSHRALQWHQYSQEPAPIHDGWFLLHTSNPISSWGYSMFTWSHCLRCIVSVRVEIHVLSLIFGP